MDVYICVHIPIKCIQLYTLKMYIVYVNYISNAVLEITTGQHSISLRLARMQGKTDSTVPVRV